ncbi:hypothetical protein ACN47E_003673 [Coniothyrium glycines]
MNPIPGMASLNVSGTSSPESKTPSDQTPVSTPSSTPSSTPAFDLQLAKHGLTRETLKNIHDLFITLAREAGKTMLGAQHEFLVAASHKNNTADIVTKYDSEIEEMVQQTLAKAYPHFPFIGEETAKSTPLTDAPTFIIDPIDGTLNFSKGVDNCGISLGLTLNRQPVIGVVFNPYKGLLYTALKNHGAFLTKLYDPSNTTGAPRRYRLPLHPLPPPLAGLRTCLAAVEWGNQRYGPNWALRHTVHERLLADAASGGAMVKSVRSQGSAALDFCYVAQGALDFFWEAGVLAWDVCAGWCILQEAGGIVASANPGDWAPEVDGRCYFAVRAAKRDEQEEVVKAVWDIMGERRFEAPFSRKEAEEMLKEKEKRMHGEEEKN